MSLAYAVAAGLANPSNPPLGFSPSLPVEVVDNSKDGVDGSSPSEGLVIGAAQRSAVSLTSTGRSWSAGESGRSQHSMAMSASQGDQGIPTFAGYT